MQRPDESDCRSLDHTLWLRIEPDGCVRIGLTDFGQERVGTIDQIRLRRVGTRLRQDDDFGRFHGSKQWVGHLKSAISGEIIQVNNSAVDDPGLVNSDPYGKGWLILIKPSNLEEELKTLSRREKAVSKLLKDQIEHS